MQGDRPAAVVEAHDIGPIESARPIGYGPKSSYLAGLLKSAPRGLTGDSTAITVLGDPLPRWPTYKVSVIEYTAIMDRELLRHLLFAYLKTDQKTQLTTIYDGVAALAVDGGHLPKPDGYVVLSARILPESDRLILQELTWELIIQGILAPGSNWSNQNLPFVRVTGYGKRCLAEGTILPHDYGTYLQAIRQVTSSGDPIFFLYLTESVEAFNKALYISCIVNLGIASEQLTLLLIGAYKEAIKSSANKATFEQAINKQRHIRYKFDELFKALTASRLK
jgi:hypothetical protein